MERRLMLKGAATLPFAAFRARQASAEPPAPTGWRRFELKTRITLSDTASPADLWVPLAQTFGCYQEAEMPHWTTDGQASAIVRDRRYGAPMLRIGWRDGSGPHTARDRAEGGDTRPRGGPVCRQRQSELDFWLRPTESLPTDGRVRATAERVTAGIEDDRRGCGRSTTGWWTIRSAIRSRAAAASATSARCWKAGVWAANAPTSTG